MAMCLPVKANPVKTLEVFSWLNGPFVLHVCWTLTMLRKQYVMPPMYVYLTVVYTNTYAFCKYIFLSCP